MSSDISTNARQVTGGRKIPNIPPIQFLQEVIGELKKVTWPTREETIKLTTVVIVLSLVVGIFIGGLDALLVQVQKFVFK